MSGPRIIQRDDGVRAYVELGCLPHKDPKTGEMLVGGRCRFRLRRDGPGEDAVAKWWHWDGNVERPTVSPSIDCRSCGKHITVTEGVER